MNMDPGKLVSVAACASVAESAALKAALEEQSIECIVNGDSLNSAFGNVAPSLSDSKLLVRLEDAEEAKSIVKSARASFSAPRKDAWFCGKCLEEVEGGFEVCWSCEFVRDEVEAPFPATADVIEHLDFRAVETEQLGRSTENPYESPRAIGVAADTDDEEVDPDVADAESKMTLGLLFTAASVFVPIIPVLIACYFFSLAVRKRTPLSGKAKFTMWLGVFVLVITHLGWLWLMQVNKG